MKNILTENKLVKNLRAYPVLHKRWCDYVKGVRELPEGFTAEKLFHDYLKVRRSNPEKRVSMSEYMIFGFYGLTTACLLYTSPSPRDRQKSRMPSSA